MRRRWLLAGAGTVVAVLLTVGASGRWMAYRVERCIFMRCETSAASESAAQAMFGVSAEAVALGTLLVVAVAVAVAARYGGLGTVLLGTGIVLAIMPFAFPWHIRQDGFDITLTVMGAFTPRAYVFILGALGLAAIGAILRRERLEGPLPDEAGPAQRRVP